MKILMIEDNDSLREIISKSLLTETYVVEEASDFAAAVEKISLYRYDCILLDIMLPDGNGLDLLRMLKSEGRNEGVLILSARDSIDDKVDGLEIGADDYLPKPFHLSELHARIRSILRRKQGDGRNAIQYGDLTVNTNGNTITVDGKLMNLSRKEYDILRYLITRHNYIIPKEVLAEAVWGDNIDQSDNFDFIYTHLKNVRRKLQEAGSTVKIQSIYGMGYKIETVQ